MLGSGPGLPHDSVPLSLSFYSCRKGAMIPEAQMMGDAQGLCEL